MYSVSGRMSRKNVQNVVGEIAQATIRSFRQTHFHAREVYIPHNNKVLNRTLNADVAEFMLLS